MTFSIKNLLFLSKQNKWKKNPIHPQKKYYKSVSSKKVKKGNVLQYKSTFIKEIVPLFNEKIED